MNQSETSDKAKAASDAKMAILTSMISATLRVAVPVLGLFFVGLAVDAWRQTTATFAITGAIFGFVVAICLIAVQIMAIRKKDRKRTTSAKSQLEKVHEHLAQVEKDSTKKSSSSVKKMTKSTKKLAQPAGKKPKSMGKK
jgi:F0F1-type ATP synthase assembly protein I